MSLYNINNKALIVDVGNTTISFAIFTDRKYSYKLRVPATYEEVAKIEETLRNFIKDKDINIKDVLGGLICSVVPMYNKPLQIAIKKTFGIDIDIVKPSYYKDVKMKANPNEVGADLVADVLAAYKLSKDATLVVDLGTVAKYLLIAKDGEFLGASFFAGIQSSLDLMKEKTALLPGMILERKPKIVLGNNTIEAMETGVYYSYLGAIKEFVRQIEKEYGFPFKKILTGGNASLFKDDLSDFIIDEDLTIKGIFDLYINN